MNFWNYRGRCIGRVIHFLYHYAGMDVAEHATIGGDSVECHGKPFAKYKWSDRFGRCDVPEFTFLDDPEGQRAAAQESKAELANLDGCALDVPAKGRVPVEAAALSVIQREAFVSANLYFALVHNVGPNYFVRDGRLFAEGKGWFYAWLPEANNWMLWIEGERQLTTVSDASAEASLP